MKSRTIYLSSPYMREDHVMKNDVYTLCGRPINEDWKVSVRPSKDVCFTCLRRAMRRAHEND